MSDLSTDACANRNVRCFLAYRVLSTARFYYPVLTILFLDYGLTLEQYSLLNLLWAITIVTAEVPSGALADVIGRRRLVVAAALLLVVELLALVLVPTGNNTVVFWVFAFNRVCSGLAEASASGADEALTYDALQAAGRASEWPHVLERLGQLTSLAFFVAMILGGLIYDPDAVNVLAEPLGFTVTQADLLRVPVALTLVNALCAVVVAWRLHEPREPSHHPLRHVLRAAFRQVFDAVCWTLSARFVLFVILAGLVVDSVGRQFAVLSSEYFRQIQLPTYTFGFVGAASALVGLVTARLGRLMATSLTPRQNLGVLTAIAAVGLVGVSLSLPYVGVVFIPFVFALMSLTGILQSHYLNLHVDSARRATVLSLKGLALNLGFGLASVLYAGLIHHLRTAAPEAPFHHALAWFFPYYLALLTPLVLLGAWLGVREPDRPSGEPLAPQEVDA